ncbi:MAG: Ig-like domain-containing protein, partial [Pseudomonadaceae bacterium]
MWWKTRNNKNAALPPTATDQPAKAALIQALEPRMMFDGAVVASAVDTTQQADSTDAQDSQSAPDVAVAGEQRQEVVFIDSQISDYQQLLAGLPENTEVVVLDASQDGLSQIAAYLDGRSGIDAIHLLTHGDVGQIQLGNSWLNSETMSGSASLLARIGESLSTDGDILLYGCRVAADGSGQSFIDALAEATGADIAASDDLTGSLALGGDWTLETHTGSIEALALSIDSYDGLLTAFNETFSSGGATGTSSFTQTIGGVSYTFTISSGTLSNSATGGESNSASIFASGGNTTISITRTDGKVFTLSSLYVRNTANFALVQGRLDGSGVTGYETVGGSQPNARTINFGNALVDEIYFTSDTMSVYIDNFVGNTQGVPSIAGLNGDSVAWAGAGNAVSLDSGSNASLTDYEFGALNAGNGDWSGASLVATKLIGASSSDIFAFNTSGALFTVSGNNLQSGGQTFATFTNTGGVLTITFTSSQTTATTALVNDVVRHLTYRNDTPAGDATIRVTLTDDGGGVATADVTVTSDVIYVTNTTDTAVINPADGVSLSEAIAIAAADTTGTQTLLFDSSFAGQSITINAVTLTESLIFDLGLASGATFSGGAITLNNGATLTIQNDSGDSVTVNNVIDGSGNLAKAGAGTLTLAGSNSYSGATTLSGGTLQIATDANLGAGSVTLSATTTLDVTTGTTIDNALILIGTANVMLSNATTFSGDISGSGNLVKQGSGSLTLSGTNSYSGTTTVSAGYLLIGGDSNLGAGTLTLENSTSLAITGSGTINNAIVLSGTLATINTATGVNATFSGIISGTGRLVKSGSGELTLSGNNSYSGGTYVANSTLGVAADNSLGSGQLTLASNAVLNISGGSLITNDIALSSSPTTINTSVDVTISGVISGSSTLTKDGNGTLTLTGDNTYSGNTIIQAGALSIANSDNISSGFIAIQNAGRLIVSSSTTLSNNVMLSGASSSVSVGGGDSLTLSGVVSGTGSLNKADGGTLILTASNTFSGSTIINGGAISVSGDSNLGTGNLQLNNGTLRVTSASTIDNAIVLTGLFLNTIENADSVTLSGVISGSSDLIKSGSGTLTLSATNTATSTLTAAAGTVLINGSYDGQVSAQSTGTVGGNGTLNGLVAIFSGGTLAAGSSPGSLTINGNLQLETGSTLAVDISGTTAGTEYDQLIVNGTVTINSAELTVNLGSYTPPTSSTFTIISNDGVDAITGSFAALTEGSTLSGTNLSLSYAGDDGNDLTLSTPASEAPVISNLGGDAVSYYEDASAVRLDAGLGAVVTDSDSADFDGGTLRVAITVNRVSGEDILGIANEGTGAGQIGVSGSNISYAGTLIGTFTGGTGTNDLVITLNANADATAVQALVSALTYRNSNQSEPSTATRTVSVSLTDGDGGSGTPYDVSVSVFQVNDVPVVAPIINNPTYTENGAAVSPFAAMISAVESGQTFTGITLTVSGLVDGSNEQLLIDGSTIALINGSGTTLTNSLSYSVSVSAGQANITITGGNLDRPGVEALVYTTLYQNIGDAPTAGERIVTLTGVTDSGGTANGGVDTATPNAASTVTVVAVNDAPTVTTSGGSTSFVEGADVASTPVVVDGGLTLSDPDSTTLASATVSITGNFMSSQDVLAFSNDGSSMGNISASYNASTGVLTLTSSGATATLAQWQSALRSVTYSNSSDSPNSSARTVSFEVNDGSDSSTAATRTVTVTATNDSPVNTVPGSQAVDQDASLVFSGGNGNLITLTDGDGTAAQVTLTATNGALTLSGTSGLTFTVGDGTADATMTFSGSLADISSALNGLTFSPTSGYNGAASISITTSDLGNSGSGGAQTDSDTIAITVNPIEPVITGISTNASNGSYGIGDVITVSVTFDQIVNVDTSGGHPSLLLETGATDREIYYVSGSGSNTLSFSYTVQEGDQNPDLDYQSTGAFSLNGATIRSASSRDAVLTLPATGSADSLGGQFALVIDGVRPTASISVADTALRIGETSTVTITFSEAVTGLDLTDFTVANGTLSNLSTINGITWTATLTPDSNVEDTSNLISLENTGYNDLAGNTGSGSTDSNNYGIDTRRPTASITVADTALAAGETSNVTITFSEAVSGLTTADFTVANGALGNLTSSDGGVTWTATLTPSASIEATGNLIT